MNWSYMMSYTGWLLAEDDRAKLLQKFPPHYHDIIAHHITLRMGEHELPLETAGEVVGVSDDGKGCQVLVVSINGTTTRPNGDVYHCTWSIDRDNLNRKPHHSKDVLKELGWVSVSPIPIKLTPMVFK